MGRIKINDLAEDQKISKDEMRKVFGGTIPILSARMAHPPERSFFFSSIPQVGWDPGEKGF